MVKEGGKSGTRMRIWEIVTLIVDVSQYIMIRELEPEATYLQLRRWEIR